ncbi:MAG: leucyl aminopeptidase [Magnetococcus sp. DMHC-6]
MAKSKDSLEVDLYFGPVSGWRGDALIAGIFENGEPQAALKQCSTAINEKVKRLIEAGWMTGRSGESMTVALEADSGLLAARLVLVGLGKKESVSAESLRLLGGTLVDLARKTGIVTACCLLPLDKMGHIGRQKGVCALAEGIWLGAYRFQSYRSEESKNKELNPLKSLFLAALEKSASVRQKLFRVEQTCRGVYLARDLCNHPANVVTPEYLAQSAREMGERLGIKVTVFCEKSLQRRHMNGILAVGSGSANPPRLITLEYRKGEKRAPLVVVGKAITFDSGGISLKPAENMDQMKMDMSGGAAVLGFMQAIAEMGLDIHVIGVIPAAENMPSGTAQRPGDIIRSAKGLYIEVLNTDAEGRLILADALHYAESFEPGAIIDLATLTGACVVALGNVTSGMLGNNKPLLKALQKAGKQSGERVWPLPMFDEYQELLKSTVADVRNIGDKTAGAITAACFLSRFIESNRPWAHIDIAGTAWDSSGKRAYVPKGSVGVGVRLLCRYVLKNLH